MEFFHCSIRHKMLEIPETKCGQRIDNMLYYSSWKPQIHNFRSMSPRRNPQPASFSWHAIPKTADVFQLSQILHATTTQLAHMKYFYKTGEHTKKWFHLFNPMLHLQNSQSHANLYGHFRASCTKCSTTKRLLEVKPV